MKRIVRGLVPAALVAAALAAPAGALAPTRSAATIGFDDHGATGGSFSPKEKVQTLSAAGAKAVWNRDPGSVVAHNVVEDDGLFDSGEPTTGFDHFKVQLSAGSFPYYCTLHGSKNGRGMAGTISVKPRLSKVSHALSKLTWATADSTSGDRYDVDWRAKGSRRWIHWKRATKATAAKFDRHSKSSQRYEARVRSFDSSHASRKSDWSPTVSLGG